MKGNFWRRMLLVILMCLGCALLSGEAMAASPGTVRFYQNSGVREFVVLRRKAAKNTNITLPKAPLNSYYTFIGWTTRANSSKVVYKAGQRIRIRGNLKLYCVAKRTKVDNVFFCKADGKKWSSAVWKKGLLFPEADCGGGTTVIGWSESPNQTSGIKYAMQTKVPKPGTYYMVTVPADRSKVSRSSLAVSSRYSHVYLVGDSRSYFMIGQFGGNPDKATIIAKAGQGYSWLTSKNGGYERLLAALKKNSKTEAGRNPAVVISLGVNDLSDAARYALWVKNAAKTLKKKYNCTVYFTTVGPMNGLMYKHYTGSSTRSSSKVYAYNAAIKKRLKGSTVKVIDIYGMLRQTAWSSMLRRKNQADGLHYSASTSLKIYNYIISCLDK